LELTRALHLCRQRRAPQLEGVANAFLAELALWIDDLIGAGNWAERACELAAISRHQRDVIRGGLLQGRLALRLGDLSRADDRLHYALMRARAVNVVEFELPALIAIADLALKRGEPAKARASLADVWEAAERGP